MSRGRYKCTPKEIVRPVESGQKKFLRYMTENKKITAKPPMDVNVNEKVYQLTF